MNYTLTEQHYENSCNDFSYKSSRFQLQPFFVAQILFIWKQFLDSIMQS